MQRYFVSPLSLPHVHARLNPHSLTAEIESGDKNSVKMIQTVRLALAQASVNDRIAIGPI